MNADQIKLGLEDAVEILQSIRDGSFADEVLTEADEEGFYLTVSQSLKLDRAIDAVKSIPQINIEKCWQCGQLRQKL